MEWVRLEPSVTPDQCRSDGCSNDARYRLLRDDELCMEFCRRCGLLIAELVGVKLPPAPTAISDELRA